MDWSVWNKLETIFTKHGIRPILAVVPDNQDPKLKIDPPDPDFWERVRGWQAQGWAIGLHGYQHLYVNKEPGLLHLNDQSEFAGLGYEEQKEKLQRGLAIFAREGVRADAWVAPSHSFDQVTVTALRELGIQVISDGFGLFPYRDAEGSTWVPQLFATLRPMPFGVWTSCCHPTLSPEQLIDFERRAAYLRPSMISLAEAVELSDRSRSVADKCAGALRRMISSARRLGRR
jgi:peptidoglycan/xylan/chitin deacetylase (PgdA/CDA1 family)